MELSSLTEAIEAACAGQGRYLSITGDAGIGKTRLLTEARRLAEERDMQVVGARCREIEVSFGFGVVRQLFERAVMTDREELLVGPARFVRPLLDPMETETVDEAQMAGGGAGDPGAPADHVFAILNGLYWLVSNLSERGPLLITVDDVHWADNSSLRFLSFLLPRLEDLPVLMVTASRPEQAHSPALARLSGDALARQLQPSALGPDSGRVLLAERLGQAPEAPFLRACFDATNGNPFLLTELVSDLAQSGLRPVASNAAGVRELVPKRISAAVAMRLKQLRPEAVALAIAVAIFGDDCPLALAPALAELDEHQALEAAAALEAARILESRTPLRFVHPLIREAIYGSVTAVQRQVLHERTAAVLEEAGSEPEQIASHVLLLEKRAESPAVEVLRRAADRALRRGAPEAAVTYLQRALEEPPASEHRPVVLRELLHAAVRGGLFQIGRDAPDLVEELTKTEELLLDAAGDLCLTLMMTGDVEEAETIGRRAITLAVERSNYDLALMLEAELGTYGRAPITADHLDRYAGKCPPGSRAEYLYQSLRCAAASTGGSSAVQCAHAAHEAGRGRDLVAEDGDFLIPLYVAFCQRCEALWLAEDFAGVANLLESEFSEARARGAWLGVFVANAFFASLAAMRGDLEEALALQREMLSMVRSVYPSMASALWIVNEASCLAALGRVEEAQRVLDDADLNGEVPENRLMVVVLQWRGQLRLAQGRFEEALEDLLEVGRRQASLGWSNPSMVPWRSTAARILAALGDRERATELATEELELAQAWGSPTAIGVALRGCGLAAGGEEGIELLRESVEMLSRSEVRPEYVMALIDLGSALRRANRRAEAREPLREAFDLAHQSKAQLLKKMAEEELEATGEHVGSGRKYLSGAHALTVSERRVAALAAEGMSNREISAALFVTVKTVETHMTHVLQKLDIGSRTEIAGAAVVPLTAG